MDKASLPYRRCVGAFIINKEKKVFVGKRCDTKTHAWQMPQGGIDDNETIDEAVKREIREETGITSIKIIAESKKWHYYDLPEFFIPKLWDGKYRGQKQKWVFCEFLGKEEEINLEADEYQEFSEYKWIEPDELPLEVVAFKKRIYKELVKEFKNIAFK